MNRRAQMMWVDPLSSFLSTSNPSLFKLHFYSRKTLKIQDEAIFPSLPMQNWGWKLLILSLLTAIPSVSFPCTRAQKSIVALLSLHLLRSATVDIGASERAWYIASYSYFISESRCSTGRSDSFILELVCVYIRKTLRSFAPSASPTVLKSSRMKERLFYTHASSAVWMPCARLSIYYYFFFLSQLREQEMRRQLSLSEKGESYMGGQTLLTVTPGCPNMIRSQGVARFIYIV